MTNIRYSTLLIELMDNLFCNSRRPRSDWLLRKALINSYCYRKALELRQKLRRTKKLIYELRENEQNLIDQLSLAHQTIDNIQLLTKDEHTLKADIRKLTRQKQQLQLDILKLKKQISLAAKKI